MTRKEMCSVLPFPLASHRFIAWAFPFLDIHFLFPSVNFSKKTNCAAIRFPRSTFNQQLENGLQISSGLPSDEKTVQTCGDVGIQGSLS
jgi:hypothetical protein